METRRIFLATLALGGIALGSAGIGTRGQAPAPVSPPQEPRPGQEPPEGTIPPEVEKKILENNDKEMKKKVERLYELASELKTQVEKTDSSKVLSLDLMKKAEEIEKLARDIKNHSKG